MSELASWFPALPLMLAAATLTWLLSLPLRNGNCADAMWSLMLFTAGVWYALGSDPRAPRLSLVLWLLALWTARHTLQFAARRIGQDERAEYRELRARHSAFWIVSLFRIFWPRALLAWVVSLPLLGAFARNQPLGWLDAAGVALWLTGFIWVAASDWQLTRFRKDPAHAAAVLDRGLWRYSRHPDYFGECCLWWGFFLIALAAGAWWSFVGPLALSVLLLRMSRTARAGGPGGNDRPQYADYVLKTNAFFPGPPRK